MTDKKQAFDQKVSAEMVLDPESQNSPKVVSDTEYLSIY